MMPGGRDVRNQTQITARNELPGPHADATAQRPECYEYTPESGR